MTTEAERRQALESALAMEFARGGQLESQTAYNAVILHGKKTNHVLHAILSLLTAGLWLLVWLVLVLTRRPQRLVLTVKEDGTVNRISTL